MTQILYHLVLTIAITGWGSRLALANSEHTSQRLDKAKQCTTIPARLERLSCFDQLFITPVIGMESINDNERKPLQWHKAINVFSNGEVRPLVLKQEGNGEDGDAWVSLIAQNTNTAFKNNRKPILIMSCINELSRVELALPSELDDARIKVSVTRGPIQYWRSDDLGVLFSSARGMPAIEMMKAMAEDKRLTLRSNSPMIDGLYFDTSLLSGALLALRSRCSW